MFKPGSWDQLAARLDEVDVNDAFDEEIGERLQRMHVPYQQNSWAILAARLELERRRVQAITHYKIMELSLLLLLFITAWQHLPTAPTVPATPPPGIPFASTAPSLSPNDQDGSSAIASSSVSDYQAAPSSTEDTLAAEKSDSDLIKYFQEVNQLKEAAQRPIFASAEPLPTNDLNRIPYEVDAQQQLKQFFAEKTETISTPSDDFHKEGALAAL
ncbi:MAG: hypothetical protein ACRBG0_11225, partial [Lewinella sp.]